MNNNVYLNISRLCAASAHVLFAKKVVSARKIALLRSGRMALLGILTLLASKLATTVMAGSSFSIIDYVALGAIPYWVTAYLVVDVLLARFVESKALIDELLSARLSDHGKDKSDGMS